MLNQQTLQKLDALGLRGMSHAYATQLDQPAVQGLTFDERLGLLVDAETTSRDTRRIERLLKAARFRHNNASLEDVSYKPSRKLERSQIMSLADCAWIHKRQSLIITGATGAGKSWLGCALGRQACRNGLSVYYTTATQLFEDMRRAIAEGTILRLRRSLVKLDLLIIDDLGIGGIDVHLGPNLLEIIDQQSAVGALMITSQFPHTDWFDLFNDTTVADAVLDRIVHRAHFIKLEGDSMRKNAEK